MSVWNLTRCTIDVVVDGLQVFTLAALPDGCVLSSSGVTTLSVWDERVLSVRCGAMVHMCAASLVMRDVGCMLVFLVLPDRRVVSGSDDGTLHVWR